ncbi:hypothetical protein BO82DRAFT_401466 [Aspergillus uvarum CBS 121591]|uniref:Uncharacterized protein n=1 Tax=Aspergillus uvarum CBS 121591 TaxID=1448315 RepID=A0A319CGN7_9EURO|nr:hypothetical protein BO82DRAFT_401466 [Aspergillus uvarum CBS 121591]PYH82477.1 hypothetical protein BO82DRAFT_401466 [Aspergillus uvarum CBS 121591]
MKFPTALILISGLTADVPAALLQSPATGSVDTTAPRIDVSGCNEKPVGPISGALPGVHLPPLLGERALSSEQKTTASSREQRRGISGPIEEVVCDESGVCI